MATSKFPDVTFRVTAVEVSEAVPLEPSCTKSITPPVGAPFKFQVLAPALKVWLAFTVMMLLTLIAPPPDAVVVVDPVPSPNCKLLKVQAVAPPKLDRKS